MAATAYAEFRDDKGRLFAVLPEPVPAPARKPKRAKTVQDALRNAGERDFEVYKGWLRHRERVTAHGEDVAELDQAEWLRSDPGYPLGVGMPLGATLREDGQSHREAWANIVRADPCAFCGRLGGTIDHIEPRALGGRDVWLNYTAACEGCNRSKKDTPLLEWLAHRRVLVRG